MTSHHLFPIALLVLVAAVLAGCGSSASNRSAEGAFEQLNAAVETMTNDGAKYALALQDCTNVATTDAGDAACAKQMLQRLANDYAPINTAMSALAKVTSGTCQAKLQKAASDASLLNGHDAAPPTNQQEADALTTQISDAFQQLAQEISLAKSACI